MSVAPWSIDGALQGLLDGNAPRLMSQHHLDEVRKATDAAKGADLSYDDALLLHVINNELISSIGTATYVDEYDEHHREMQNRFMQAYEAFNSVVEGLSEPLKSSVRLPDDYCDSIKTNIILTYASERPAGRPREDRKDEFYTNILVLYQMVTGQRPGGGESGPTVRFFRAMAAHLKQCLEAATDRSGDFYDEVSTLWKIPASRTFLKDWARNKGGIKVLLPHIDQMVSLHIAAHHRTRPNQTVNSSKIGDVIPFPGPSTDEA